MRMRLVEYHVYGILSLALLALPSGRVLVQERCSFERPPTIAMTSKRIFFKMKCVLPIVHSGRRITFASFQVEVRTSSLPFHSFNVIHFALFVPLNNNIRSGCSNEWVQICEWPGQQSNMKFRNHHHASLISFPNGSIHRVIIRTILPQSFSS